MKVPRLLRNVVRISLPTLVVCLAVLDLFFRFVIPACRAPYTYYDPTDQLMRFDANGDREGVFTIGRFARQRGRWRVNNYGWNSDIDYVSFQRREKPLIAIIGDSYIEAFQVNIEDSIVGVLRRKVGDHHDVYGFGISGEPLSGYLQMSRYVNKHFKPDVLVFNVVHNDFEESVRELVNKTLCLQISYHDGTFSEVPGSPYHPSLVKRILRKSALVRYLTLNLGVGDMMKRVGDGKDNHEFNANIDVTEVQANRELVKNATSFLVGRIREENPGKELIFMIDAPRNDIYSDTLATSNVLWLHQLLKDACSQNNCRFIDLTQPFADRFRSDAMKFNSEYDSHWNELGHKTAAEALCAKLLEFNLSRPAIPNP